MIITSSAFENNREIPKKYSCDGDKINPPIEISEVPDDAKSIVLIMDDPDAPSGIFVHWVVWNIDHQTSAINENSVPANAIQGTNSGGNKSYYPPCPPSGSHRYFFKVYALDSTLDLPTTTKKDELLKAIEGKVVDQGELIGTYSK